MIGPQQLQPITRNLTRDWDRNAGLHARRMRMAHMSTKALVREDPTLNYRATFKVVLKQYWQEMPCPWSK